MGRYLDKIIYFKNGTELLGVYELLEVFTYPEVVKDFILEYNLVRGTAIDFSLFSDYLIKHGKIKPIDAIATYTMDL